MSRLTVVTCAWLKDPRYVKATFQSLRWSGLDCAIVCTVFGKAYIPYYVTLAKAYNVKLLEVTDTFIFQRSRMLNSAFKNAEPTKAVLVFDTDGIMTKEAAELIHEYVDTGIVTNLNWLKTDWKRASNIITPGGFRDSEHWQTWCKSAYLDFPDLINHPSSAWTFHPPHLMPWGVFEEVQGLNEKLFSGEDRCFAATIASHGYPLMTNKDPRVHTHATFHVYHKGDRNYLKGERPTDLEILHTVEDSEVPIISNEGPWGELKVKSI